MSFFEKINLFKYFERQKWVGLSIAEKEVIVETLVMVMMVDHHIDPAEEKLLHKDLDLLGWDGEVPLESYVQTVMEYVNGGDPLASLPAVTEGLARRITTDWLPKELYYLAANIALSDSDMAEEERLFLSALVTSLGLTSEEQRLVIQRIRIDDM